MDPITTALQLAFYVLFGVSVLQYVRNRGPLELSVMAVFGSIAALFALTFLNTLSPGIAPIARPLLIWLLLAQPYLVLRLIAQIRPVRPTIMRIALIGLLAAWEAVVLLPPAAASLGLDVLRQVGSLFAVLYFFAVELGGAAWFAA